MSNSAFGPSVPALVIVNITAISILNLAHGRATTTNAAAHVDAAAASAHDVEGECSDEGGPAEPQEGAGSLCLAAILLGVCGGVADAVGSGVCLENG